MTSPSVATNLFKLNHINAQVVEAELSALQQLSMINYNER